MRMNPLARIFVVLIPLLLTACGSSHLCEEVTLENGLRVVFTRVHSPIVSAVFLMDFGEMDGPPGLARRTNELLLKGTDIRNAEQINQEIESVGGIIGTETGLSSSIATIQTPVVNFIECFQILCECLVRSTFDSTELSRTDFSDAGDTMFKKGLILKKQAWGDKCVRDRLYPNSTLSRDLSSIHRSYSRSQILEFARLHVQPQRMVLSIAGEYDKRHILDLVKRHWQSPVRRRTPSPFDTSQALSNPLLNAFDSGRGAKDTVFVALKGPMPFSDGFLSDNLAEIALSLEKDGLLALRLAAEGIKEAEIRFYSQFEDDYSYFVIHTIVPLGQGVRTRDIIEKELKHIAESGVSEVIFQIAKRRLESTLAIRSQYTLDNAWFAALTSMLDAPYRTHLSVQSKVQQITLEEVNRSASRDISHSLVWVKTCRKR
jgi:predicted Zn-dependent peptidase